LLESYADFFVYTLPAPRYNYYTSKNYEGIQDKVTKETNKMIAALGFYQPIAYMGLLKTMQLLSLGSLNLGLIFSIIVILFTVVSVLLIYSLLMISVETKSFENGVLRLVGLSQGDCI
jgi:hypothetical protein